MERGPARDITRPQPGYWMLRLRKNAPEVPAAILLLRTTFEPDNPVNLMERSAFLAAYLRGQVVSLPEVWERRGRAIDRKEYEYQLRLARWADHTDEMTPLAEPTQAVDLNSISPIF